MLRGGSGSVVGAAVVAAAAVTAAAPAVAVVGAARDTSVDGVDGIVLLERCCKGV